MKISANNLAFRSLQGTVIDGASFSFTGGQKIALYGPQGSGKKVLLLMLGGYLKPASGAIMLDNENVFHKLKAYRNHVGLGETDNINPLAEEMTIRENVEFALEIRRQNHKPKDVQKILDNFGIKVYADTPVKKCSPFACAIASLACATVHNPDIVLLDEPTKKLTSLEAKKFWEIANKIFRDETVIFSTKNFEEAKVNSDKIISLDFSGHIIDS